MWLIVGILLSLAFHSAAQLNNPTNNRLRENANLDVTDNPWIQDNVIYKPNPPPAPADKPKAPPATSHSIRAAKVINVEALRQYLESKHSPLAAYAEQISASAYSSTIIGICTIEQYGCAKAPYFSPYNFWGIMKPGGGLAQYASYEAGIAAIDAFLTKADNGGRNTLEKLNGWYVVPASSNWFNTVLKIKTYLDELP